MSDAIIASAGLQSAIVTLCMALLVAGSARDIAVRTIPDWTSLGLATIGVTLRLLEGTFIIGAAAAVAVFALAALCWRCGWLGGGDVKLLAACSLLVPPIQVPHLVLLTSLAGGAIACLYLVLGRLLPRRLTASPRPIALIRRIGRAERWRIGKRASLPYGCAISVATLAALFGQ